MLQAKFESAAEDDFWSFLHLSRSAGTELSVAGVRTRKMLRRLAHGCRLIVEWPDPPAVIDIPHLLRETGDTLEHQEASNGLFIFHIKRGKG
jgi:tRNA 2-thiouridine synthesizing protein A